MGEAHVPAQQSQAQEDARVPAADADTRGSSDHQGSSPARAQAAVRLIWRVRDRATFEALGRARPATVGPVRIRRVGGSAGRPRVAYVVGRSAGNAVERNRLRRRLRAAVREHVELLDPGAAYLVAAGPEALEVSFTSLCAFVRQALVVAARTR
jgi:ribonuclease P protein component